MSTIILIQNLSNAANAAKNELARVSNGTKCEPETEPAKAAQAAERKPETESARAAEAAERKPELELECADPASVLLDDPCIVGISGTSRTSVVLYACERARKYADRFLPPGIGFEPCGHDGERHLAATCLLTQDNKDKLDQAFGPGWLIGAIAGLSTITEMTNEETEQYIAALLLSCQHQQNLDFIKIRTGAAFNDATNERADFFRRIHSPISDRYDSVICDNPILATEVTSLPASQTFGEVVTRGRTKPLKIHDIDTFAFRMGRFQKGQGPSRAVNSYAIANANVMNARPYMGKVESSGMWLPCHVDPGMITYEADFLHMPKPEGSKRGSIKCAANLGLAILLWPQDAEIYVLGAAQGFGIMRLAHLFPNRSFFFIDKVDMKGSARNVTIVKSEVWVGKVDGKTCFMYRHNDKDVFVPHNAIVYSDMADENRKNSDDPASSDLKIIEENKFNGVATDNYAYSLAKFRHPIKMDCELKGRFIISPFSAPHSTEGVVIRGAPQLGDVRGRINFHNQFTRTSDECYDCKKLNELFTALKVPTNACTFFPHGCEKCACALGISRISGETTITPPFQGFFLPNVRYYNPSVFFNGGKVSTYLDPNNRELQAVFVADMAGGYDAWFLSPFLALSVVCVGKPTILAATSDVKDALTKMFPKWSVMVLGTPMTVEGINWHMTDALEHLRLVKSWMLKLIHRISMAGGAITDMETKEFSKCIESSKCQSLTTAPSRSVVSDLLSPGCLNVSAPRHICWIRLFKAGPCDETTQMPNMLNRCGCNWMYSALGMSRLCTMLHSENNYRGELDDVRKLRPKSSSMMPGSEPTDFVNGLMSRAPANAPTTIVTRKAARQIRIQRKARAKQQNMS